MNGVLMLLVEVSVVFALALLGVRQARRARAAVRHLILVSAFGVVLVLPLATLVSPPVVVFEMPSRADEPVAAVPAAALPVQTEPRSAGSTPAVSALAITLPAKSVSNTTWLLLIWMAVALAALAPVGASLAQLRGIRRRGHAWPQATARMNELAHAAGVQPPMVLLNDGIAGPIASGILRPVIVLPSDAVNWSETHVTNALVHELEHVRRRDWAVHLIARVACALYWFHPLARVAWRALRLEAERASDDAVLARDDAATYAEQLLELARHLAHKPAPGLAMAGGSDLSTRIGSVLDNMRPRGRAGKVMIAGTVLAAVIALVVLAPLRITEDAEVRMYRAADVLAQRTDADSLAAAGLLRSVKARDDGLRLLAQATVIAPDRPDLVWLQIQLCEAVASCDPEPLESRLRSLDEKNGAGWLGALARAGKRGDAEGESAALAAIARSERVDLYWTRLVARLSRPVASTKELSLYEAEIGVVGILASKATPAYKYASNACSTERLRLMGDAGLEVCRGVAKSFLNGDTVMTEMIGVSIAKRAWPENSPKWMEANEAQRIWDSQVKSMQDAYDLQEWVEDHPDDHVNLLAQHRREQDALKATFIAIGKNPNPATLPSPIK